MSKKPLLSESQVAKWMKLANIDKNATENFLTENKKNKKVLKEMYGGGASYARGDEPKEMGMDPMEELEGMDDMGMGDGAMGDEESVVEPEGEGMGAEGELEFDSVDDLKQVLADAMASDEAKDAIKAAVMDALQDLGLADEMGGDEEEDLDLGMEGGDEGGDEPAEPAEEEQALEEGVEVLTDDEVINEVLKRVIRRLV